jgi:hypothetical protein
LISPSQANHFNLADHLFVTANTTNSDDEKSQAKESPPPSYDANTSSLITSETAAPSINQTQSNQTGETGGSISRSESIRSNVTICSANPSIRTTNSIGTSSSIGNASFNLLLPLNTVSSCSTRAVTSQKRMNMGSSSKSFRRSHQNRHVNQQRVNLAENKSIRSTMSTVTSVTQDTASACFSETLTTRTENSFQSSHSEASKIALYGSANSMPINNQNNAYTDHEEHGSREVVFGSSAATINQQNLN